MLWLLHVCYSIDKQGATRRENDMELHECYGEVTAASGRKYWIFLGWAPLPDGKPIKVTAKFRYYDTPHGREKFRM